MKTKYHKHVCIVIQDMFRQGAQYVTAMVVRGFVQRGYHVDLIVSKIHRDFLRENPSIKPFDVPESVRWIHLKNRRASRNILELARYFRQERPMAVFTMSENYDWAVGIAMWFCGRTRPLFLPVEHSSGLESAPVPSFMSRIWTRIWCQYVSIQLVVSDGVKSALFQRIKRFPLRKIFVVYNPVIDEMFFAKLKSSSSHPWLKDKRSFIFVAAGAHCEFKRFDVLIKALARIRNKDARLILFGDGYLTDKLKSMAVELGVASRVDFPGFVNNLPAELKSADAFVLSSESESFSVVLVEALATGIPVISTACPYGPPDILENGKYGLMCPINDPDALARQMQRAIDGQAIKPTDSSWRRFTLDSVMDRYEESIRMAVKMRADKGVN